MSVQYYTGDTSRPISANPKPPSCFCGVIARTYSGSYIVNNFIQAELALYHGAYYIERWLYGTRYCFVATVHDLIRNCGDLALGQEDEEIEKELRQLYREGDR